MEESKPYRRLSRLLGIEQCLRVTRKDDLPPLLFTSIWQICKRRPKEFHFSFCKFLSKQTLTDLEHIRVIFRCVTQKWNGAADNSRPAVMHLQVGHAPVSTSCNCCKVMRKSVHPRSKISTSCASQYAMRKLVRHVLVSTSCTFVNTSCTCRQVMRQSVCHVPLSVYVMHIAHAGGSWACQYVMYVGMPCNRRCVMQ